MFNLRYQEYDKAKYHSGFCIDIPADKAAFMADYQVPVYASVFAATIAHPAGRANQHGTL